LQAPSNIPTKCYALAVLLALIFCSLPGRADVVFGTTNSTWKWLKGRSEASTPDTTAWRQPEFNDASWNSAPAPFYYSNTSTEPPFYNGGAVTGTVITDMVSSYTCIFLRKTFVLTNVAESGSVLVEMAADDGCIVWLNGQEIGRTNMPAGEIAFDGRALASLPEPVSLHQFSLPNGAAVLREGTNVLAVQAFNWDPTSGDFGVMAGLSTTRDETPPAVTTVEPLEGASVADLTSVDITFSEPVTNVIASALLINGAPTAAVNPVSATRFLFTFAQPATGLVSVAWSPGQNIRDLAGNIFAPTAAWTYRLDTNRIGTLVISEFMADNDGILLDGHGEPSDWIEIHNPTALAIKLGGWKLQDRSTLWTFPDVMLPAGGYLIVFASGKLQQPYTDPAGYLHTNFRLDADGEPLALLRPDYGIAWEYRDPDSQRSGISFGLLQPTTSLVTFESPARIHIPNASVSDAWRTNGAFDDSTWISGQASAGFGQGLSGGTVAYRVHAGTPGNQAYDGALGMDFVVNQPVIVIELGCFDDNSDGLNATITVQLWRRNENGTPDVADDTGGGVLASMTFNSTAPGNLFEGSRFKPLTLPLTLTNGAYTIIGYGYGANERAGNAGAGLPPEPWETQSGGGVLSFVGSGRPGPGGTFPTVIDGGPANRYAAGTFKFAGSDEPAARSDLRAPMQHTNSTALMRVPFTVANPGGYDALSLRMGYDDGCVVWLNGSEIVRRNAPEALDMTSAATQVTNRVETIPLDARLLVSGTNLLAVHGLNITASDGDFFMATALSGIDTQPGNARYFPNPTPGGPNSSTGVVGYVADTKFSVRRGFYDAPFDLFITNATPGATIRYTLDGSIPTLANGMTYTGAIRVASTTVVRAFAHKSGFEPSNVDTHTYIFANDVAVQPSSAPPGYPASWTDYTGGGTYTADYGMINPLTQPANYARAAGNAGFTTPQARSALANSIKALPIISVVTDRANLFDPAIGMYLNPAARGEAWERPASVELITTGGVEDWHAAAGIHVMGLTSRRLDVTPKLNFMLVFSRQYGDTWLTEPFFGRDGPNRIKRIALRTNTRDSWLYEYYGYGTATYIADGFAQAAHLDSGEPATRHRYCHVFLNGIYWGLYDATQRPESHWAETTFGGEDEDYDVVNLCCGNRLDSGDFVEWEQLLNASRAGLSSASAYQAVQGNNLDGSRNPTLKRLLGVDSLIGFLINGYYHASIDWPNNFFAIYDNVADRTDGWRFVIWDSDLGFPNMDPNENRVSPVEGLGTWLANPAPGAVDAALRQNPEYRVRMADRIQREFFNNGAYTSAANEARWQRLCDAIQPGLYAESARWGDYRSGGLRTVQDHWLPRTRGNIASNWFANRNTRVIAQLRGAGLYPAIDPPQFNQFGGSVPANFQLAITHSNASGTVYFTLDGTDPRLIGGGIASGAQVYSAPITLAAPTLVRARVRSGTSWSALVEAQFYPPQDFSRLQLSEIMFNPRGTDSVDGDEFEFLELYNSGETSLNLSGLTFSHGVNLTFTNGTLLGSGQYLVLARNAVEFAARYPGVTLRGLYTGRLDNNGENLALTTASGAPVFAVTYSDAAPWPAEADDSGLSLQRLNFSQSVTNPVSWTAAQPTPGRALPANLLDADADGLPDAWEATHNVSDPNDDPDEDGFSNYQEFLAGTHPRDEDDRLQLRILSTTLSPNGLVVASSFAARSNKTYSLLYGNAIDASDWNVFLELAARPTNTLVITTNVFPSESGFLRIATPRLP
jgi:hypothetical protein